MQSNSTSGQCTWGCSRLIAEGRNAECAWSEFQWASSCPPNTVERKIRSCVWMARKPLWRGQGTRVPRSSVKLFSVTWRSATSFWCTFRERAKNKDGVASGSRSSFIRGFGSVGPFFSILCSFFKYRQPSAMYLPKACPSLSWCSLNQHSVIFGSALLVLIWNSFTNKDQCSHAFPWRVLKQRSRRPLLISMSSHLDPIISEVKVLIDCTLIKMLWHCSAIRLVYARRIQSINFAIHLSGRTHVIIIDSNKTTFTHTAMK